MGLLGNRGGFNLGSGFRAAMSGGPAPQYTNSPTLTPGVPYSWSSPGSSSTVTFRGSGQPFGPAGGGGLGMGFNPYGGGGSGPGAAGGGSGGIYGGSQGYYDMLAQAFGGGGSMGMGRTVNAATQTPPNLAAFQQMTSNPWGVFGLSGPPQPGQKPQAPGAMPGVWSAQTMQPQSSVPWGQVPGKPVPSLSNTDMDLQRKLQEQMRMRSQDPFSN